MSYNDSAARKPYIVKALTLFVAAILIASPLAAISPIIAPAQAQAAPAPALPQLSPQAQQLSKEERNWEYIASGRLGGNYNPQKQITKDNIQSLELKWIFPIPSSSKIAGEKLVGFANYPEGVKGPSLIVDGVIYIILNSKTVIALDAKTAKQIWVAPAVANNNNNSVQAGGKYPITTESAHTHGFNYIDGQLWISDYGCSVTALDAKTGKVARQYKDLCLEIPLDDPRGVGIPGNSGWYGSLFAFPPVVYKGDNSFFFGQGGANEGTFGGRLYFASYDLTTGKLKWRTFLVPPCGDPATCKPLFQKEKQEWGQWLVDNCNRIWIQQIKACQLDQDLLRNDWGNMRFNSGVSQIWSTALVDEETGMIYFGTAQAGPEWNNTYTPGFKLFGASVIALNGKTGQLVWAHQTTAHDLWDYDCSWNGILATVRVKGQMRKVVMKGCKNGIAYVLDAATGEAYHVFDPPSIRRTPFAKFLDPRSKADMTKPWQHYPSTEPLWQNCPGGGCLESDIAFDPQRNMLYFASYNNPGYIQIGPVEVRGTWGLAAAPQRPYNPPTNYTLNAYDLDTGKLVWEFTSPNAPGYRGGLMVSGGLVWPTSQDGTFRVLDADTGKVLYSKTELGNVQPNMGATSDGKMIVLRYIGDGNTPGALAAYGLPDKLPEPQVVTKEVIKEVPKEVIKEVPKEVVKTVTVETISPISYAAIGVSVVILVIAGVLFSRRKKA